MRSWVYREPTKLPLSALQQRDQTLATTQTPSVRALETSLPPGRSGTAAARIYGSGEMADLTRAFDWSRTSVGPIEHWSDTLLITVNTILSSRQPMFLFWGDDLVQFYNDAYRTSIRSDKHPRALGQRGEDCWPEIWPIIGPQIGDVMKLGLASWNDDQLVPIYRDGKLEDVYWTYSYSPVRNPEGVICATLVTCTDTTGRVLAERQLQQVLEVTTDAVVICDRTWKITYMNRRAGEILAPQGHVLDTNLWQSFPGAIYEGSPFVEHYNRAMDEGIEGHFEAYYAAPLNIWVHVIASPTQDGIVIFFRDVTDQKRTATALMQAEKLAAVGRLAASIAHEINNPLESVTNLLYLARASDDFEEVQAYLDTAERELRRVAVISNLTLRFHKQSASPTPVSVVDLLHDTLALYQGRIVNSGVLVEERFGTTRPVWCFEGEIRQVVSNLIANAIDAMHARGGRLLLRVKNGREWRSDRRGLTLTVADTGGGIDREVARKIFEPFFTTKGSTGTGLGLWVSQEIVTRHKGSLRVRSSQTEGQRGAVFTLFLPFDAVVR